MTWKQIYRVQLVKNYKSLQLLHQKNALEFSLTLPEKLNTKEQLLEFGKQINNKIAFPEINIGKNYT